MIYLIMVQKIVFCVTLSKLPEIMTKPVVKKNYLNKVVSNLLENYEIKKQRLLFGAAALRSQNWVVLLL